MDAAGDIFIADACNARVREVNHLTGAITTVAGNGISVTAAMAVRLSTPNWASPGASRWTPLDKLFIADWSDEVIREVNLSTGIITTVAGNGSMATAEIMVRPSTPNSTGPLTLRWTPPGTSSSPSGTGSAR